MAATLYVPYGHTLHTYLCKKGSDRGICGHVSQCKTISSTQDVEKFEQCTHEYRPNNASEI